MKLDKLILYRLQSGETVEMPIDDIGPLIKKTLSSKLIRDIVFRERISKFFGFLCRNDFISKILSKTKLADKINSTIATTYKQHQHKNLNAAFIHRGERKLFPVNSDISDNLLECLISSPADAYMNIRDIVDKKVELYPNLLLDIEKMVGENNSRMFEKGGKFLLLTLKPFHDHTVDYPVCSQVINITEIVNKKNKRVLSTDLYFVRFIADLEDKFVFSENHRMVTKLFAKSFDEEYLFIEVGATNVNSIEQDNCQLNQVYKRGTQKSHFNFGSTVILLLPDSFQQKLYFPHIYHQGVNISVEVKRRNIIACTKDFQTIEVLPIGDGVGLSLEYNEDNQVIKSKIVR